MWDISKTQLFVLLKSIFIIFVLYFKARLAHDIPRFISVLCMLNRPPQLNEGMLCLITLE